MKKIISMIIFLTGVSSTFFAQAISVTPGVTPSAPCCSLNYYTNSCPGLGSCSGDPVEGKCLIDNTCPPGDATACVDATVCLNLCVKIGNCPSPSPASVTPTPTPCVNIPHGPNVFIPPCPTPTPTPVLGDHIVIVRPPTNSLSGLQRSDSVEFTLNPTTKTYECPDTSSLANNVPDDLSVCSNPKGMAFPHCMAKGNIDFPRSGLESPAGKLMLDKLTSPTPIPNATASRNLIVPRGMNAVVVPTTNQCQGLYHSDQFFGDTIQDIKNTSLPHNAINFPKDGNPKTNPWLFDQPKDVGCPHINEVVRATTIFPFGTSDSYTKLDCRSAIDWKKQDKDNHGRLYSSFGKLSDAEKSKVVLAESAIPPGSQAVPSVTNHFTTVLIQRSPSERGTVEPFERGYWACEFGYRLDVNTGNCVLDTDSNKCDAGTDKYPPSAVSSISSDGKILTPEELAAAFEERVNKKLSCCMNDSSKNINNMKFDCHETPSGIRNDFNKIWKTVDADGTFNAVHLISSGGFPLSGFYTDNAEPCTEFSAITNDKIQPGIVSPKVKKGLQGVSVNGNPAMNADDFQAKGLNIEMPSGKLWEKTVIALGDMHAPRSVEEKRRCKYLARAVAIFMCPAVIPSGSNAINKTQEIKNSKGEVIDRYCTSAEKMQVHLEFRQIWQEAGSPLAATINTVIDSPTTGVISVKDILARGHNCPVGTIYNLDKKSCQYVGN